MKQFDLVNKLRERLNNLEVEEARLLEVIKRLEKDLADWKSRTQYANRISYLERDLRVDAEARLAKAESLIGFVVTEDVGDESEKVRGVFTDLEQAVQGIRDYVESCAKQPNPVGYGLPEEDDFQIYGMGFGSIGKSKPLEWRRS
jgi:predicted phage gp36 major capsid-like protein